MGLLLTALICAVATAIALDPSAPAVGASAGSPVPTATIDTDPSVDIEPTSDASPTRDPLPEPQPGEELCGDRVVDFSPPTQTANGSISWELRRPADPAPVVQTVVVPADSLDAVTSDLLGAMAEADTGRACVLVGTEVTFAEVCGTLEGQTIEGVPLPLSLFTPPMLALLDLGLPLTCFALHLGDPVEGPRLSAAGCATVTRDRADTVTINGVTFPLSGGGMVAVEPLGRPVDLNIVAVDPLGVNFIQGFTECGPPASPSPTAGPSNDSGGSPSARPDEATLPPTDLAKPRQAGPSTTPALPIIVLGLGTLAVVVSRSRGYARR